MIRFMLQRSYCYQGEGMATPMVVHSTIDADVPELEERLRAGGRGSFGHDLTFVVGVEVLPSHCPLAESSDTQPERKGQ